jgi:hypothetical protein
MRSIIAIRTVNTSSRNLRMGINGGDGVARVCGGERYVGAVEVRAKGTGTRHQEVGRGISPSE